MQHFKSASRWHFLYCDPRILRGIGNIIILTTFFLRDIFVTKILSSAYYYAFGHIFALSHYSLVKVS